MQKANPSQASAESWQVSEEAGLSRAGGGRAPETALWNAVASIHPGGEPSSAQGRLEERTQAGVRGLPWLVCELEAERVLRSDGGHEDWDSQGRIQGKRLGAQEKGKRVILAASCPGKAISSLFLGGSLFSGKVKFHTKPFTSAFPNCRLCELPEIVLTTAHANAVLFPAGHDSNPFKYIQSVFCLHGFRSQGFNQPRLKYI